MVKRQHQQEDSSTTSFEFASSTSLTKEKSVSADGEVRHFARMVQQVRGAFRHDDEEHKGTNRGYVTASKYVEYLVNDKGIVNYIFFS